MAETDSRGYHFGDLRSCAGCENASKRHTGCVTNGADEVVFAPPPSQEQAKRPVEEEIFSEE
jgi:hypothetical protein